MRYTVQSDQTWKLDIILQDSLLAQVLSSWCCGDHSSPTTMTSKSRFEPKVQGEVSFNPAPPTRGRIEAEV